ncbi:hypothetical protein amrb99_64470 [Actinomadura sp. RB99]|uniref:TetR/AcrR family transcriptional regulator n=1 Tax=Actinomadura sp. RB99 TaxID=2691577 RepID=UPI00199E3B6F|nr:TetR family transcriptional regulator [Actinomadura sp. RB99]MBD2897484.1 hypothetical protein [Actinomadura sp. RB99]
MNDAHGDLRPEGDPTDASDPRTPRPPSGGSTTPSAPPTETTAGTATLPDGPAVGGALATTTLTEEPGESGNGTSPRTAVPAARPGEPESGSQAPLPPSFGGSPVATEPRTLQRDAGRPQQPTRGTGRAGHMNARQERREQTRTALLSAAERLWAERGIHGASLDDIAAAAGLTKGAVYSNFAGKTDLLLALLERFTSDRLGTDVCDELRSADQARDDDERTGRNTSRDGSDDRARRLALLLVEFWLYGMRDYAAGWRIADWYAERRAHLASELRDVDGIAPSERAALAMALDFGLAFQHLLDPDRVPADLYSTGIDLMLGRAAS